MAKERGLDTYVVFWSIFVSEEFAKAHNVAKENFYPHYYVPGDTSDITKRYLRESVTQMLEEYPDLDGIGVSHGEGMAGMTPLARQQFVDEVYHRRSAERETQTAREAHPSRAIFLGPVVRARRQHRRREDHAHGHGETRPQVLRPHLGGDEIQLVAWPLDAEAGQGARRRARRHLFQADAIQLQDRLAGAQRRLLRAALGRAGLHPPAHRAQWARRTTSAAISWARKPTFPRSTTSLRSKDPVSWKWAFQRQWLFYKLWGRLLYDPKTPDALFQAEFTRRYGKRGENLLQAYSLASNTQMRLASLYDSRWDFTLYGEGMLALQGEHTNYIGVDALINQPTLDPAYVSVAEFVKTTRAGGTFGADRITPLQLADLLERDCREAVRLVNRIDTADNASLRYEVADVQAWAYLGVHLAEKLRGAVALATYRIAGDEEIKQQAIGHLQQALGVLDPAQHHHPASLPRHEAHALQRQLIRCESRQPVPLGTHPRRSRARRRGRACRQCPPAK